VAEHVLDPSFAAFRAAFDKAMTMPVDAQSKLQMLQPAMDALGDVVLRTVHGSPAKQEEASTAPSAPALTPEQVSSIVTQRVAEEVAPLKAMLEAALASRAAPQAPRIAAPQPRHPPLCRYLRRVGSGFPTHLALRERG
jgi:hypothetical protein